MSKKKKWWWLVRTKVDDKVLNHLLYASFSKNALQMLPPELKVFYEGRTTWQALSQLTGCLLPPLCEWNKYATGPLLFDLHGQTTVVYPQLTSDRE